MRLFTCHVTLYMKSGNILRFRATEFEYGWTGGSLTKVSWKKVEGIGFIDPNQVEAIQSRRGLNWRRAFRG